MEIIAAPSIATIVAVCVVLIALGLAFGWCFAAEIFRAFRPTVQARLDRGLSPVKYWPRVGSYFFPPILSVIMFMAFGALYPGDGLPIPEISGSDFLALIGIVTFAFSSEVGASLGWTVKVEQHKPLVVHLISVEDHTPPSQQPGEGRK